MSGLAAPAGTEVAVKVFKISMNEFRDREKYIQGPPSLSSHDAHLSLTSC